MIHPMYIHSVPVFKQLLTALKTILAQASEYATAKSIEPDALLQARLAPDMFPLLKQVQIAADFSRGVTARLAGVDVLVFAGQEKTFADLDVLLTQTFRFWTARPQRSLKARKAPRSSCAPARRKRRSSVGRSTWRTTVCRSFSSM